MKFNRFLLALIVPAMMIGCNKPDTPQDDPTPTPKPDTTTTVTPTPDLGVELAPEIKSGDCVLAPNVNVEKFISEVTYPDRDYSYSVVLDYHGGYNGKLEEGESVKSDKPSEYTFRWEANEAEGKLKLELAEIEK